MANVEFKFQVGFGKDNHLSVITKILQRPEFTHILISVAYVSSAGVEAIIEELKQKRKKAVVFLGINNEITSKQALERLVKEKINVFAVDTASSIKFHPKVYAAYNASSGVVVTGSTNLTQGGLLNNIEASSIVNLNRRNAKDEKSLRKLISTLESLPKAFPQNVFKVKNKTLINWLFSPP